MYDDQFVDRLKKELSENLARWCFGPESEIDVLTVSENATFIVRDDLSRFIIRVHRPNYHSLEEIESELAWLDSLNRVNSLCVPRVIKTNTGELSLALNLEAENDSETKHADAKTAAIKTYAVAFEFLDGDEPVIDGDLESWFKKLGEITASLHKHAKSWQVPKGFVRKYWRLESMLGPEAYWGNWKDNSGLSSPQKDLIDSAISLLDERLSSYGESSSRYGLVHADLRLANLLVSKDELKVIDFDDCGYCWYIYDFAAAISFYETDSQIPNLLARWLEGYRAVSDLPEADAQEIPSMILLRRILLTAWLASHAETPTAAEFGEDFASGTADLAVAYLASHGRSIWLER